MTLTYQIRFPVGFNFVYGGKLPGLCGGGCWTGDSNGPGGWTTRYMWRAGGAGEILVNDCNTTGTGTDLLGSWSFQPDGLWHTISQHIVMNTPSVADGTADVTYDGVPVGHFTGLMYRCESTTHVDSMMFSTFFGGSGLKWSTPVDTRIDMTGFTVG